MPNPATQFTWYTNHPVEEGDRREDKVPCFWLSGRTVLEAALTI